MKLDKGKLNISIGGCFGSEGKGLLNSYLHLMNDIDISIGMNGANAGHTFIKGDEAFIAKYLPVTGILSKRNQIYLCPGSIINPSILLDEIAKFDIDPLRMAIHPNCTIIDQEDIDAEADPSSSVTKIASTQTGNGHALSRKILRSARIARDVPELQDMILDLDVQWYLEHDCTVLIEVPQGFELSLDSQHYPYCTSRNIDISSAMGVAQVHPYFLGKVACIIRSMPIRVGHLINDNRIVGESGPVYDDQVELAWEDVGIEPEITTVTQRRRRIFSFSMEQYRHMLKRLRPDYLLLNFANYLNNDQLANLLEHIPEVTHLGFGRDPKNIKANHGHFKGDNDDQRADSR